MPEQTLAAAPHSCCRYLPVKPGCGKTKGSNLGDETPKLMTSAMTQPPQRRRKFQTKYGLGLEHTIYTYLIRKYLAQYDTRRWLRHPSCPHTEVGCCYLPRYRYNQKKVTQRQHDQNPSHKLQTYTTISPGCVILCTLGDKSMVCQKRPKFSLWCRILWGG